MRTVGLAGETDLDGWRAAARALRLAGIAPADVTWSSDGAALFAADPLPVPAAGAAFGVPRDFLNLAADVVLNRAPDRFDLLYRLLWRLQDQPDLLRLVTDPDTARALALRRQVAHAIHKMHAFVRFRLVQAEPETYVAWFEPPHRVAAAASGYFVKRMANLRFSILTPDGCVHWDGGALAVSPGVDKAAAPTGDALEAHWRTYYASVFNPARLNPGVMAGHMPKAYWRNLPEAAVIPGLIDQAKARTTAMVQAAPTEPSARARRAALRQSRDAPAGTGVAPASLEEIAAAVQVCRRCDLWRDATQGVPGEGPVHAAMMFVGEQPGDQEDLAGRPFVGPAGAVLDKALAEAGVPRAEAYVTNAVKHFKHEPRGKRRLHKTPDAGEVQACRWWLDNERRLVRPKVVVALGATAARAVLGRPVSVMKERGPAGALEGGAQGFVTVHPSMLLRIPDRAAKAAAYRDFVRDLAAAWKLVA
jgi:DNA polymerase